MDNELNETINFEVIKQNFQIRENLLLKIYLRDISQELCMSKGISNLLFYDFMNGMPMFLTKKLFNVFNNDHDNILSESDFQDGIQKLCTGNFCEIAKIIFTLCDFQRLNYTLLDDVKLILFYFMKNYTKVEHDDSLLKEIERFLKESLFRNSDRISYETFIKITTEEDSDLFFVLLIFLYKSLPFSNKTLKIYKNHKLFQKALNNLDISNQDNVKLTETRIITPSKVIFKFFNEKINNLISGCINDNKIKASNKIMKEENLNIQVIDSTREYLLELEDDPYVIKIPEIFLLKNIMNEDKNTEETSYSDKISDTTSISLKDSIELQDSKSSNTSQSSEDQNSFSKISNDGHFSKFYFNKETSQIFKNDTSQNNVTSFIKSKFDKLKEIKIKITFESYIYKYNSKGHKMNKTYIVLIGKEMYYFKNSSKKNLKGMHYLTNYLTLRDKNYLFNETNIYPCKYVDDEKYYSFNLFINKKERVFYTKTLEDYQKWIDELKNILNVKCFLRNYKLEDDLYIGKFTTVRKAIDKKSGENVAVKIFSKIQIISHFERFCNLIEEVDIMKSLNHRNIVKYIDFFEDLTNFYIIMEYLEGGDLTTFIEFEKYDFNSLGIFTLQICESLLYLHSIGVVHRDIKPMNIGIKNKLTIKIIDFGFSTIIGNSELCIQQYGTTQFAAPEILLHQRYNKNIDIWSLGVTIYNIYFNQLPFEIEENLELAYTKDIQYPYLDYSEFKTEPLKDLIKNCLQKECYNRFNIENVCNHNFIKWLRKYYRC